MTQWKGQKLLLPESLSTFEKTEKLQEEWNGGKKGWPDDSVLESSTSIFVEPDFKEVVKYFKKGGLEMNGIIFKSISWEKPSWCGKYLNKALIVLIITITLGFTAFLNAAKAEPIPPKPDTISYVYDYANLIDASDEDEIKTIAHFIDMKTRAQIVVVTVNDLNGMALEDYSLKLLRGWGIGDKQKNNGVLLLVNKENLLSGKSGRIRIEVGYGLEGAINDAKAGRILDNYALPAFEQKEYSRGITDAFMAIASEVAKEYNLDMKSEELSGLEYYGGQSDGELPLGIIVAIIIFIIILFILIPRTGRGKHFKDPFDGPFFGPGPFGGGGGFGGGGFGGGGFGGGSGGGGGASR